MVMHFSKVAPSAYISTPSDPKVTASVHPAVAAALVLEQNKVKLSEEISYCQCQQLLQCRVRAHIPRLKQKDNLKGRSVETI